MKNDKDIMEFYYGCEVGPIRPPSEAHSLLIRVTRNCHWNRCTFCPVYKQLEFSRRPIEHVKTDIDFISKYTEKLQAVGSLEHFFGERGNVDLIDSVAYQSALHWYNQGMKSVFIQDADSLILKPSEIIEILTHLRKRFPSIERITSYARSSTIAKIDASEIKAIGNAGLNRIHIGMESGSDKVLKIVRKGASKKIHIKAGTMVKNAGIELSEYVMPGLGGITLSEDHALETADALNQIDPDFIRLRHLAIPDIAPISIEQQEGRFESCSDLMVVRELRCLISNINSINSRIVSDHILNLLPEIEGQFPEDKEKILSNIDAFLEMDPMKQRLYQLGKRIGILYDLSDLEVIEKIERVEKLYKSYKITPDNIDEITDNLMKRFI